MTLPVWSRFGIDMTWRGTEIDPELFLGNLCVGYIFPLRVEDEEFNHARMWRVQIMTTWDSESIGGYASVDAARDALVDAVLKALFKEGS